MFTLAHLSDPHLAPMPRPTVRELMGKRAMGFINWKRGRQRVHRADILSGLLTDVRLAGADHIAVTGDLINISLEREYAPARRLLESLGDPASVTLVPGNHDTYLRESAGLPGRHWGDYMRGDASPPSAFPFVRRRGPVALIGLSTSVPTGLLMSSGWLGRPQLEAFADLLPRYADYFRVVMIHHPPHARSQYLKRLVDAGPVRDIIAAHGAELVIHGHDHAASVNHLDGPAGRVPMVGVPSASSSPSGPDDPAAYNLYGIEGERGRWQCQMTSRGYLRGTRTIVELGRKGLSPAA